MHCTCIQPQAGAGRATARVPASQPAADGAYISYRCFLANIINTNNKDDTQSTVLSLVSP